MSGSGDIVCTRILRKSLSSFAVSHIRWPRSRIDPWLYHPVHHDLRGLWSLRRDLISASIYQVDHIIFTVKYLHLKTEVFREKRQEDYQLKSSCLARTYLQKGNRQKTNERVDGWTDGQTDRQLVIFSTGSKFSPVYYICNLPLVPQPPHTSVPLPVKQAERCEAYMCKLLRWTHGSKSANQTTASPCHRQSAREVTE